MHKKQHPDNSDWRRVRLVLPMLALMVVVLLYAVPSTPAPPGPGSKNPSPPQMGLRTIILDPGHGGLATGTTGPGGITEKDITLDIAVRLRELIYRRIGLQVFLTREADDDVYLDQRPEKANNWAGDLFISIHANGYPVRTIRGPETYFLSASASDQIALEVAASENAASDTAAETDDPVASQRTDPSLDFILWDLAQIEHLREGSMLAETVQARLTGLYQIRNRGVKQAPFRVLKGVTMPAILVEVGYLTNDQDAVLLADPFFRQQIAEVLFRSINDFRDRYATLVGAVPRP